VHYNHYNEVSNHVLYTLSRLRLIYSKVIFVSNSQLSNDWKNKLQLYTDEIMQRENIGFDFGAWKETIINEGWENLTAYDYLTLMNDTCFGPMFELKSVYEEMENNSTDFWGITNHKKTLCCPEHLQSYFLSFSKKVIVSKTFMRFWEKLKYLEKIENVIYKYEIKLTEILTKAGFKYSAYIDTARINSKHPNLSNMHPDRLIMMKCPFIKIKGFIEFDYPMYLKALIEFYTKFPIKLIDNHFNSYFNPNISFKISNKTHYTSMSIRTAPNIDNYKNDKAICIVYSNEVELKEYIENMELSLVDFDLFLIVETDDVASRTMTFLDETKLNNNLKNLFIVNQQNDYLNFLEFFKKMYLYEVIGFIYIEEKKVIDEKLSSFKYNYLKNTVLKPINEILDLFHYDKNLGLVIDDIPYHYLFSDLLKEYKHEYSDLKEIWSVLSSIKNLNIYDNDKLIIPFSDLIWFRSLPVISFLEFLIDSEYKRNTNLLRLYSLLKSVRYFPVYILWTQGYDFKVIQNSSYTISLQYSHFLFKDMKRKRDVIHNSLTFRIGRLFVLIPQSFYRLYKLLLSMINIIALAYI